MTSFLFPDVNVWLALTHSRHAHHAIVAQWFASLADEPLFFCRFTQLGLLRLLTSRAVMGVDVLGQRNAWAAYRRWFDDGRIEFLREPEASQFERCFEEFSGRAGAQPATKLWADAYLAAFAKTAGLTLVTLDQAFRAWKGVAVRVLAPR